MVAQSFSSQIIAKNSLTAELLEIRFTKPLGLVYEAGQFLQLLVPPSATPRSYSLSSTPADDYLEFLVKLHVGGLASEYFKTLQVGDEVKLNGSFGRFINTQINPIVGIATGTGLVPVYGIFRDELVNKKNQVQMHLIFGVHSETDLFWVDRLEELAANFPQFTFTVAVSQPDENWLGSRGRVTNHLKFIPEAQYFICGNPEMVKDVRTQLLTEAVPQANIHLEIF